MPRIVILWKQEHQQRFSGEHLGSLLAGREDLTKKLKKRVFFGEPRGCGGSETGPTDGGPKERLNCQMKAL